MQKSHYSISVVMAIAVGVGLLGLLGTTVYYLFKQAKFTVDKVIADDISFLQKTFLKIDASCEIMSIRDDRNFIDFLQIKDFSGNQVGPLQLRNSAKWEGPYAEKNPTVQGKDYELVRVKDGYAIVPGKGVKLASGKIMGKDIVVDATTDIEPHITQAGGLFFKGRPLAARIRLHHTQVLPDLVISEAGV